MIFRMDKNLDRSFFRFVTMHAFDRRTDGQTEFSSLDRVCTAYSALRMIIPCDIYFTIYKRNEFSQRYSSINNNYVKQNVYKVYTDVIIVTVVLCLYNLLA